MIFIQNLLRANGNRAVQKTYKQLDVKYVATYYSNCMLKGVSSKINILPFKWFHINDTKDLSTFKDTSKKSEDKIRIRDNIPVNYSLIYRAPMLVLCKLAYPLGLLSAIVLPTYVYVNLIFLQTPLATDDLGPLAFLRGDYDLIFFTLSSVAVGCSILLFVFKYPFRIFHRPSTNEYIAVLSSVTPFKTKNLHFTSASKVSPESIPLDVFKHSVFKLDSKKVLLIEDCFKRPFDLEMMLKSSEK